MVLCYARSRQQIRTPAMYQARVLMEYTPRLIKSLLHRYLSSSSYPFGGAISLVAVTCHHAGANMMAFGGVELGRQREVWNRGLMLGLGCCLVSQSCPTLHFMVLQG